MALQPLAAGQMTVTPSMRPSGEKKMPSGVWPTVTVSTTRGASACRSIRLMVSASPWPAPTAPSGSD
jgi:hypothetical protein